MAEKKDFTRENKPVAALFNSSLMQKEAIKEMEKVSQENNEEKEPEKTISQSVKETKIKAEPVQKVKTELKQISFFLPMPIFEKLKEMEDKTMITRTKLLTLAVQRFCEQGL